MNKELSDYILRQSLRATIPHDIDPSKETEMHYYLNSDYILKDGLFSFPAGESLSYIVDGKDYNPDRNIPLDIQKKEVINYLKTQGYEDDDIKRFLATPEYQDGREVILDQNQSKKWFETHPEYKQHAIETLEKAKKELEQIRERIETKLTGRKK